MDTAKNTEMFDEVVSKQTALLEKEISDLKAKANHLGEEIETLGSAHFSIKIECVERLFRRDAESSSPRDESVRLADTREVRAQAGRPVRCPSKSKSQEWLTIKRWVIQCILLMKTVTLKIPDSLNIKIRRAIARRKEKFSHLARRALAREVEEHEVDFARLAAPYRGMFRGLRNLSSREGYGNKNHR